MRTAAGRRLPRSIRPARGHAVTQAVRQSLNERSVDVHHVDIFLARAVRTEDEEVSIGAERRIFVVPRGLRQAFDIRPIGIHDEDIEATVDPTREANFIILR